MPVLKPLALDLGTESLGWACDTHSGFVDSIFIASRRTLGRTERHSLMCMRLSNWLADCIQHYQPNVVVIEQPFFSRRTPDAGIVLNRLFGAALAVTALRGLPADDAPISLWQRWAKRELGWTKIIGDDANDARGILAWWLAERGPFCDWSEAA
jgi:RNase H-fold protein (predicted Holliday junction resolvase)